MNISSHFTSLLDKRWVQQTHQAVPPSEKKIRARFAFALALLLVLGAVSYQTTLKFGETELWEAQVEAALTKVEHISSGLKDAEIGKRDYLITGDEQYLELYREMRQTIDQELRDLRPLIANNPGFQRKIDSLAPLIARELATMPQIYDWRKKPGLAPLAQMALMQQDQQIIDDVQQSIKDLEHEQNQLLQTKTDEADTRDQTINLSITFGSFLAIMLAAFMISRDIAERKRTDAALRESAARFHRLSENALDMIYRYRLLPTPGFEYVSPAATAITGYAPEDFYADPDLGYKLVHPEERTLIESLKHPSDATMPLTVRWMHKDGTIIWTSQQLVPIYSSEGQVVAIEGIVRDVTERMQAYQMLERRVEERTVEIERRRQVAESLRDIVTILNSNRTLDEILDSIVAQACRLLETDAGAVYRLDDQEELLSLQAARGLTANDAALNIPIDRGIMSQVVLTRQHVAVADTVAALQDVAGSPLEPETYARLARLYQRYSTLLAVPLMIKDEVYGAIALYYEEPREFSREEIEMAVAFSDQAALAIENARLRVQAEQMAVAAERSRLARELHDAVTQTLFSTSLIADVLPRLWERDQNEARRRLDELRQLTRGALAEMRTLLLELRPSSLIEVELPALLRQLAEATTGRVRIPVALMIEGQCRLPPDTQIAFYRIAQEALNNMARHANAGKAAIDLHCRADEVELRISDNGQGFDPGCVAIEHMGLSIMRERAEAIGATLRVESQPGSGAQIIVIWPQIAARGRPARNEHPSYSWSSALSGGRYD
jgi:PAS domain S-box-containing protein